MQVSALHLIIIKWSDNCRHRNSPFKGLLRFFGRTLILVLSMPYKNNWTYQAKWIRTDQSHLDSYKSYSRVANFFNSLAKNLATTRNSKIILIYTNIHSHKITQYYQINMNIVTVNHASPFPNYLRTKSWSKLGWIESCLRVKFQFYLSHIHSLFCLLARMTMAMSSHKFNNCQEWCCEQGRIFRKI